MAYRDAVDPSERVALGPFPVSATLLTLSALLAGLGALVLLLAALAVESTLVHPESDRAITCMRSGDLVTCTEQAPAGARTIRGPARSVHAMEPGRNGRPGLVVGGDFLVGVSRGDVEEVRRLRDGASVSVTGRAAAPPVVALLVGLLFGALLLGMGASNIVRVGLRRRAVTIRVTPTALEIGTRVVAREPDESVSLTRTSGGRGGIPLWRLTYGAGGDPLVEVGGGGEVQRSLEAGRLALVAALGNVVRAR